MIVHDVTVYGKLGLQMIQVQQETSLAFTNGGQTCLILDLNGIFNLTSLEVHTTNSAQYIGSVQRPGE